jgi:hypothetical protein
VRTCAQRSTPIFECMGFVKAGDLIEFQDGVRAASEIREICARCSLKAFRFDDDAEGLQSLIREQFDGAS